MKKEIATVAAPSALGPYSQAIEANGMIYLSGQLGLHPVAGSLPETVEAQAERALQNIAAILDQAGSSFDKAVKTTIFLADMGDFAKVNEVYGRFFNRPYPARSTVQVACLPKNALVEIEVIALA